MVVWSLRYLVRLGVCSELTDLVVGAFVRLGSSAERRCLFGVVPVGCGRHGLQATWFCGGSHCGGLAVECERFAAYSSRLQEQVGITISILP